MVIQQLLENAISVVLYVGIPVIPLVILATLIGRWHTEHADPPPEETEH